MCLANRTYVPNPEAVAIYERLYPLFRLLYFALGEPNAEPSRVGEVLPELRKVAAEVSCARGRRDDRHFLRCESGKLLFHALTQFEIHNRR